VPGVPLLSSKTLAETMVMMTEPDTRLTRERLPEDVRELMHALLARLRDALGDLLLGVYVVGSATNPDYEPASSDIDVCIVLSRPLGEGELTRVRELHRVLREETPRGGKLEVVYVARDQLRSWGAEGEVVSISPGEELRVGQSSAAADDIWGAREHGIPVLGPPARKVFPKVDPKTLAQSCRTSLADYATRDQRLDATDDDYVDWILSSARCLFGIVHGRFPTKPQAAAWLLRTEPELAEVLDAALAMRKGELVASIVRTGFRQYADTVLRLAERQHGP
jgi:predicted nucleotidyltransferase